MSNIIFAVDGVTELLLIAKEYSKKVSVSTTSKSCLYRTESLHATSSTMCAYGT